MITPARIYVIVMFVAVLLITKKTIVPVASFAFSSSSSTSIGSNSMRIKHEKKKAVLYDNSNGDSDNGWSGDGTATTAGGRFDNSDARAGSDGYSVLRQPVQWDLNADPEFDVPDKLKGEDGIVNEETSIWWSELKNSKGNNRFDPSKRKPSSYDATEEEDNEELDLYQRSLDTLDYPRVLKELTKECTTVPARKIVKEGNTYISLNNNTKSNLSNSKKGKKKIPKSLLRAYTPLTADSVEGVQERYTAVQEMEQLLFFDNSIVTDSDNVLDDKSYFRNRGGIKETLLGRSPPFRGMNFDLDSILQIADQGSVLEGPEILEISTMMGVLEDILLWGTALEKQSSFVELPKIVSCISLNTTLQTLLENVFDEDGKLSGTTFPKIGSLRSEVRTLKASIISTLDGLITMPSIRSKLALESGGALYFEVNGGRLVIPIEAKYASSVGIVHDSSRSGKTSYVEPTEVVGPTNALRQAESNLKNEEARVWRSITGQILDDRVQLEASVSAVGQLDLVQARLYLGRTLAANGEKYSSNSCVIPEVRNEGVISLRNAKHPVLILRGIPNVVGSDVNLGNNNNQGLVLTGPNSGGKTIILKLLGLTAMMVRAGIPISSSGESDASTETMATDDNNESSQTTTYRPRVDFFDPVLADIGDIQSVDGDLSTFSGHMLVCREILNNSGRNALVLMDEIGSGTDPNQGVAIAQALLEAIVDSGARVAITTHYMQLKQLAAADDRFAVGGMQFVNGRPTYKLLSGIVGESFALAVAERLQIPTNVISRAESLMDSETRQMGDLIRELEDQKAKIDKQAEEIEQKKKDIKKIEYQLIEEKIRLEQKQLTARRSEAKKFAKMLEEKEQVLETIMDKLKSDPSRKVVAKSWDDIKFVKRDAISEAENVPSVLRRKQKAAKVEEDQRAELIPIAEMRDRPNLQPGDTIVVLRAGRAFGTEASVVRMSGRKGVEVLIFGTSVALKLSEVSLPPTAGSTIVVKSGNRKKSPVSAAEKALMEELNDTPKKNRRGSGNVIGGGNVGNGGDKAEMRTEINTVDVRGCNLDEASVRVRGASSDLLMLGRSTVYVLHGHGTGVLKTKLRKWLNQKDQKEFVRSWKSAEQGDGGDAFTRILIGK